MLICVLLAYCGFTVYFCGYFFWFLIFVFSVLANRLAGKSMSEMTYYVSSEMYNLKPKSIKTSISSTKASWQTFAPLIE